MNHKTKLFKLSDLFNIKYGVNLELCNCEECDKNDSDAVNFVSRTSMNNGVSGYVKKINDLEPQPSGLITLAGGGSVLSTFLQTEPFYSGRDLYTLESKTSISNECKLYLITLIKTNRYRYAYGRQANKTFPELEIELPIVDNDVPNWQFMENYIKSLHYKPLTTKNKASNVPKLNVSEWKEFKLSDLFKISGSVTTPIDKLEEYGEGKYPYVTTQAVNNGVESFYNYYTEEGECLTVDSAVLGYCSYQCEKFSASDHVEVLRPKYKFNMYIAMFLVTIMNKEQYRYSYGRKCSQTKLKSTILKLPAIQNEDGTYSPDWEYMENYIKSLPYGDRI